MKAHDVFWKLDALSDRQLLERMGSVLGSSRRLMAELIAHLGEVEERRLHLAAACSSMFAYCLKLGMTEDEAYRRIEVARLARRFPAIFPMLADGQLSISVVALLKHHLSVENHLELLAAAAGKSVAQTRELIAARFPRPDVPSSVRKLPERRTSTQPSLALSAPAESRGNAAESRFTSGETAPRTGETAPRTGETAPCTGETAPRTGETAPRFAASASGVASSTEVTAGAAPANIAGTGGSMSFAPAANATCTTGPEKPPTPSQRAAPPPPSSRIEPLSAKRYKILFTASAELARKLELARDLMRHSRPDGELGPIVERGLDLLIESLMHRRFGRAKKAIPKPTSERGRHAAPEPCGDIMTDRSPMRDSTVLRTHPTLDSAEPHSSTLDSAEPHSSTLDSADVSGSHRAELERASDISYIPRSTRRAVVERDGLSCSWLDERGVRCGSRAWLEYDHRHPRAKGGGSELDNVRLLCRHHNRFAAEREFGRRHVERTIAKRRRAHEPPAI